MKKDKMMLLVALAVVILGVSRNAAAQSWKPNGNPVNCEKWDEGRRLRCRAEGKGSVIVTLTNTTATLIKVRYDEYHSLCSSGSRIVHENELTVPASGSQAFPALAAGTDITCRELFVATCKSDGNEVPCANVLTATYQWYKGNQQ